MSVVSKLISRRRALKGMVNGAAVTVGVPFLDCFLNENGNALAADGSALPTCYVMWTFGLGLSPGFWEPKNVGPIDALAPQMKVLEPYKKKMSIVSGTQAFLDGRPLSVHGTGMVTALSGSAPLTGGDDATGGATLDVTIGEVIGKTSRFPALYTSSVGTTRTDSSRGANGANFAEISPVDLYARIFGPEFRDPSSAEFTPDKATLLRKSALSVVSDQRKQLTALVGAEDRRRLEDYFESVRSMEQQLELQLQRPLPMPSCSKPNAPDALPTGVDVEVALTRNRQFAALIAHAMACGQTRIAHSIINRHYYYTQRGLSSHHHIMTHEEPQGPDGYQPTVYYFNTRTMEAFGEFLKAFESIREGDGTLLDRSLVHAATDNGLARSHSVVNLAHILVGSAGGKLKTGLHVRTAGEPVTRIGLTVQNAFGLHPADWGTLSNKTSRSFTELLA